MINKRNKRNLDKDKTRKNRKKSNFFSEKRFKKKNWKEIKVVSTNILKDKNKDKNIKEKKDKKSDYDSIKTSNFKKTSENKNEKNLKLKKTDTSSAEKKTVLRNHFIQYKLNKEDRKTCSKCNKKIEEMTSAIKDNKSNKYYHFNCVMDEIKKDNAIESKQRIVYLGSGAFGIIENLDPRSNSHKFVIKKKIQYIDND